MSLEPFYELKLQKEEKTFCKVDKLQFVFM